MAIEDGSAAGGGDDLVGGHSDPTDQEEQKRDKGVMVYLTDAQRAKFRAWAFDNEVSMSDVLAKEVDRLLGGAERDWPGDHDGVDVPHGPVKADSLIALTSQRDHLDSQIANALWSALADGARIPDLVAATGLSRDCMRELLSVRRPALPGADDC